MYNDYLIAFADGHLEGYSVIAQTFATQIANAAWEQIPTLGKAPVELMKTASREIEQAQQGFK